MNGFLKQNKGHLIYSKDVNQVVYGYPLTRGLKINHNTVSASRHKKPLKASLKILFYVRMLILHLSDITWEKKKPNQTSTSDLSGKEPSLNF